MIYKMENVYGIGVANRYALFIDEEEEGGDNILAPPTTTAAEEKKDKKTNKKDIAKKEDGECTSLAVHLFISTSYQSLFF